MIYGGLLPSRVHRNRVVDMISRLVVEVESTWSVSALSLVQVQDSDGALCATSAGV